MPQMIFVNLAVSDAGRSKAFYQGLGYTLNPQFSDESTGCIVVSDSIFFMLLERARFADFSPRPLGDPAQATTALVALNCDDRAAVDAMADKAVTLGGTDNAKTQDLGFMYSRSLSDPDGHILEFFWMDPAAAGGG